MKTVFARISTAIVAAAALVASAFVFAPAAQAAGITNSAVNSTGWELSSDGYGLTTGAESSSPWIAGAASLHNSVTFRMGGTQLAARAGHTIRITWNQAFPTGASWSSNLMGMANGVEKNISVYSYGTGTTVTGMDPYLVHDGDTTSAWLTGSSNTIVIPASFSAAASDAEMSVTAGISAFDNTWIPTVGAYTIAPTLYDVTSGEAIAVTSASVDNSNTTIGYSSAYVSGDGNYPQSSIPAGVTLHQTAVTCVLKADMATGDILKKYETNGASTGPVNYSYFYKKGENQQGGNIQNGTYTVQSADVDSAATGFRFTSNFMVNNTQGSSALDVPVLDQEIKKFPSGTTDFSTGGTVINQSCAPAAPTTAPTFTFTGRARGTMTWAKDANDTGFNSSYSVQLIKSSDNSVVETTSVNGSLNGNTYTGTVYFSNSALNNTNYVVKYAVRNWADGVNSDYSPASTPTMLVPPAKPGKPTLTSVTVSSATATVVVASTTGLTHRAYIYSSADNYSVSLSSSTCSGPSTTLTCNIYSQMTSFAAPNTFKVKVIATNNSSGLESDPSDLSDAVVGGYPGVTLGAPSQGTGNGEAKTLTTSFPWITDTWSGGMGMPVSPKGFIINDSKGTYYALTDTTSQSATTARTYTLRKIKADNTGFDTAFGTVTKTVTGPLTMNTPSIALFAGGTKFAMTNYVNSVCGGQGCTQSQNLFTESTFAGAPASTINISSQVATFCTDNLSVGAGNYLGSSANVQSYSVALSRPLLSVYCSGQNGNEQFVASIATDGALTYVAKLLSISDTQNWLYSSTSSVNPNATGTQVAALVYVVRAKRITGNPTTYTNFERALIRIKADGTATETTGVYTPSGSSEPNYRLAPVNDGTNAYVMITDNSGMMPVMTIAPISVASGNFGSGTTVISDGGPIGNVSFPAASVPVVNGEIALIRTDYNMSGQSYGPARLTLSTGRLVTGEMLSVVSTGTPLSYAYIDAAGNMNYMYTPATNPAATTHTVVQWKNVRALVAQPTPMYMSKDIAFSVNAGGAQVTITGTNFNLTTLAKKVVSVSVGAKTGITVAKTATTLKFAIPTATLAGASSAPTSAQPFSAPVTIVLGSGTVSAGMITYVGADKLAQTATNTTSDAMGIVGSEDRAIVAGLSTAVLAATPGLVPTAAPAAVCTIVAGKVHFVGPGACTVTAASAANSYLLAATPATRTIQVRKADAVTVGFGADVTPNASSEAAGSVMPVITLASGRTDYTITGPVDTAKCEVQDDGSLWFKQGNQDCVVTIATSAANATHNAVSYQWTIRMLPPIGADANSALQVPNNGVTTKVGSSGLTWLQSGNSIKLSLSRKYVGLFWARMTFTPLATDADPEPAPLTCDVKFGSAAKVAASQVSAVKTFTSPAFCTDVAGMNAAQKTAQAAVYAKFKALVAANKLLGQGTAVSFKYKYEKHFANTGALYSSGGVSDLLLSNQNKPWTADSFANLYYLAFDSIAASLPTGASLPVSADARGAVAPIIALGSKRLDFTLTSADETKCAITEDGRIWAKVADDDCVVTIATENNAIWKAKSYTWTIPMVDAVGDSADSAPIAPSNATAINAGPITLTWNQATNSVIAKYTARQPGKVTATMTFKDVTNADVTCTVNFGSAAALALAARGSYVTQTSVAFCTDVAGLSAADKAAQVIKLNKFKAAVAAKKTASAVLPISISYKFERHNATTGALEGSALADLTASTVNVKLNYRATAN